MATAATTTAVTTTTTTTTTTAAPKRGLGALRLVIDNRERELAAALDAYLPIFNAARPAALKAPLDYVRIEASAAAIVFLRADGTHAYVCARETLAKLVPLLDTQTCEALGLACAIARDAPPDTAATTTTTTPTTTAPWRLSYSVAVLPSGDVAVQRDEDGSTAYVGERKAGGDLAASIGDARYRSQKLDLQRLVERDQAYGEYVFEIARGQRAFMDPAAAAAVQLGRSRVGAASLRGAVQNTAVRDLLPTPFTEDAHATARHIVGRLLSVARFDPRVGSEPRGAAAALTAEQRQLVVSKTHKRRQADATPATLMVDMLRALPLVGDRSAVALQRRFGSVAALVRALPPPPSQWALPGEYKRLAKALLATFDGVEETGIKTALSLWTTLHGYTGEPIGPPPKRARATKPDAGGGGGGGAV